MLRLARLYVKGARGAPLNLGLAREWARKAAARSDPETRAELESALKRSEIPTREEDDGNDLDWLRQAAEAGESDAERTLGLFYLYGNEVPRDARLAADWLLKAARGGDEVAAMELALLYAEGADGVTRDLQRAVSLCPDAASASWEERRLALSSSILRKDLPRVDHRAGFLISLDMARRGNVTAMNKVAYLYDFGFGAPKNPTEANRWSEKSREKKG